MRLGVLGPLSVLDDAGTVLPVTAGKQRVLLAALAVRANRIVPVDELVDLVWDGVPPRGAVRALRVYVVRLRHALGAEVAARIITHDPGYSLQADQNEVDVLRFAHLCQESGEAARVGTWQRAAGLLADALSLWRGVPLVDVPSETLRERELPRLTRLHEHAVERRIDTELHLGHHEHVVAELRDLITRYPLREHVYAQLMLALAGLGNQAEALNVYQHARRTLVDQLGVEPGPELRRCQDRILASDPTLSAPERPSEAVPRMLPAAVADFTGRDDELKELSELLTAGESTGVAVVSAIGGTAGVGKTALAIRWAHQHADRFPDGQLYVNLRGYDPDQPMSAADALAHLLRALGLPEQEIPADVDERAARYRSLLAGRRTLIVADNAGAVPQVRPLLPGAPTAVLLVTSRDSLAGLVARDGARRVDLDVLALADAVGLLRGLIGARVAGDPHAAAALADQCARLPLALRVAAERAISRPTTPLADLVRELADQQRRLDVLDVGGDPRTAVRAVLSWSYRHLALPAAGAFRMVSLHPGTELDVHAAAALIGTDIPRADALLAKLARAYLVQPVGADRYTMHDLLRAYGRELAADHDDEPIRRSALTGVLDHYANAAATAVDTVHPAEQDHRPTMPPSPVPTAPVFGTPAKALAWLDAERANLVALAMHAAAH
ncbi:MAG TPA: BTAD domain-containing putative transcriptional regulator, partial [Pseudonocardiaceae bacterium]|nr:BTAD domain-containing putative transcriptional regulator [Pseudonocardiaceae bacterium]